MKIIKTLVVLNMARSNAEANRLVKQGSVLAGNCSEDCTLRVTGKCNCGGWHKVTNPTEEVFWPIALRIKDGSWRLMAREDGKQGFDQLCGCGITPSMVDLNQSVNVSFWDKDNLQIMFWKILFKLTGK